MILKYHFDYKIQNGAIPVKLEELAKKAKVKYSLSQKGDTLLMYVDADEQVQIDFSNKLSNAVPLSIFLNSTEVEVVDEMETTLQEFENRQKNIYLYPEQNSDVDMGYISGLFDKFMTEGEVALEASDGVEYKLCKIDKRLDCDTFLVSDLSQVARMVVASEAELTTLASLEKPFVKLNVTQMCRYKEILPARIKVKLAHDVILLEFAKKLFENEIEAVSIQNTIDSARDLEVVTFEKRKLIVSGDVFHPIADDLLSDNTTPSLKAYEIVLKENEECNANSACFYVSKNNTDAILLRNENKIVTYLSYNIDFNIANIFKEIENHPNGAKLLDGYKKKFSKTYEYLQNYTCPNPKQNIYSLWGLCGLILGYSEDFESSCEKILDNVHLYSQDKAPLIDYKLLNKESRYELDFVRTIRSTLSYAMADIDEMILSWGIVQSFVDLLVYQSDIINQSYSIQKFALCGGVFAEKRIIEESVKKISPNHQVLLNKAYAIDNCRVPLSSVCE